MNDFKNYSKNQLLDLLNQNGVEDAIELYQENGELIALSYFQNGNYYLYSNAEDENLTELSGGPYKDLKEAQLYIGFKYPNAQLILSLEDDIEEEKEIIKEDKTIYEWRIPFYFTVPIDEENMEDAYEYLREENMLKYYGEYTKGFYRLRDIRWILTSQLGGYVRIKGQLAYLSNELKKLLLSFIREQNSDGLGEGFSQQDFAMVVVGDGSWLDEDGSYFEGDDDDYDIASIVIDEDPEFERIDYR